MNHKCTSSMGMLVAIIQSTDKRGTIILEAEMKGVSKGKIEIETK